MIKMRKHSMWLPSSLIFCLVALQMALQMASCAKIKVSDPFVDGHSNFPTNLPPQDLVATPPVPLGSVDTIESDVIGEPLSPGDFIVGSLMMHAEIDLSRGTDPIEMAGLFQGDIVLKDINELIEMTHEHGTRNAVIGSENRWVDGVIPYVISASYSAEERGTIAMAMQEFHQKTCLKFVPRSTEKDYIHILKGDGCSSSVGLASGAQAVSLGPGCVFLGIVMHELMHTTGFWHEQSRDDRDSFITINWPNVQEGMAYNFQKYDWNTVQNLGVDYDLGSIMHYGPYAFARDRTKPTIIPRTTSSEIGQRRQFSQQDIDKLNRLYNCQNSTEPLLEKPTDHNNNCADDNTYCEWWARKGECVNNPKWMDDNCRRACGLCVADNEPACVDTNSFCAFWSHREECNRNNEYMSLFCKVSCGVCKSLRRKKWHRN